MSESRTIPPEKIKLLLWLSTFVILLAAVGFVLTVGDGWSWPLFLWGALSGPAGVLVAQSTVVIAKRYLRPTPGEIERSEAVRREVVRPARMTTYLMGLPFGAIAASTGSAAPDVLATVGLVVMGVLPLAMLPSLKRRAARERDTSQTD